MPGYACGGEKLLRSRGFTAEITGDGCIDRIAPVVSEVEAKMETIGAIADENAKHVEKVRDFFQPGIRGDCIVVDGLSHEAYSFRHQAKQPAEWHAEQKWADLDEYWEWTLEIRHMHGAAREMSAELVLPHPVFPGSVSSGHSMWTLWAPVSHNSLRNDYGIRKFHHCKCIDERTDIPLPLCTLFHSAKGLSLGLSYLLPPDQTWYTDFEFDQRKWITKITFNNLALVEKGSICLKFWIFSHEGDWRPALGWVRNKFPELFAPVPGQEKLEGNMAYTVPMIPEKRISEWSLKMNLRWNELIYWRDFGNYFPDEPFNASQFKTLEHPEWTADNLTYDDINRYIEMCHKHNVKVMPYFNIADCESGIARKYFPSEIVRVFNGAELVMWKYYDKKNHTILVNSDPAYPFFDFIISQFEKLLSRCPGIDGFFFDQMGYGWIDTAHFDGLTFYDNKPAYNLANMYLRALKKMREIFPRPRINGIGNGVGNWQMMQYLDGVMAEGDPEFIGRLSMLAPERPAMFLAEGENAFQLALLHGSWLHVSPYYRYPTDEQLPGDALELFSSYNPLLEFLEGRKWVYSPDPLEAEVNSASKYRAPLLNCEKKPVKANIFKTFWGEYAVVALALHRGLASTNASAGGGLTVRIKVPDCGQLKQAVVFGADYKGYIVENTVRTESGGIEVRVRRHGAATMIIFTRDLDALRALRNWKKFSEGTKE